MTEQQPLHEGQVLTGALFNEPLRVETVRDNGNGTWVVGLVGTQSERFRKVALTAQDLAGLAIVDAGFSYDGDGCLLRQGLQAYALGIAWEFDPYFDTRAVATAPTALRLSTLLVVGPDPGRRFSVNEPRDEGRNPFSAAPAPSRPISRWG